MRRTVTLEEDVVAGIRSEMERTGESFKQAVNRLLRPGFGVPHPASEEQSKAKPVDSRKSKKKS